MRSILGQGSWILAAQVLTKVISFLYTIFLARSLGVSDFGIFSVALAYFAIASSITEFGFNKFLTREVAKDKVNSLKLLWNIIAIRILLTSVLFFFFSVILYTLDQDKMRVGVTLLALLAVIPQSVALTFDAVFIAIQKLQFSALSLILSSTSTALVGILFITLGFGPVGAVNSLIIGQVIYLFTLVILLYKDNPFELSSVNLNGSKKIIIGALPYGILGIIGVVSFRIDTLILSYFWGNFQTGIYSVAYKFLEAVSFIPVAIAAASFPVFARSFEKDIKLVKNLYFKSIKIMLVLGFIVMFLYIFILPEVLKILLPNYLPSLGILKILALSIPLIFIHIPSNQVLLSGEKYLKQLIAIYFGLFSLSCLLYFIFIPILGGEGAAWVTVVSEMSTFIAFFFYLNLVVFKKT